jgi:hypothetical protein
MLVAQSYGARAVVEVPPARDTELFEDLAKVVFKSASKLVSAAQEVTCEEASSVTVNSIAIDSERNLLFGGLSSGAVCVWCVGTGLLSTCTVPYFPQPMDPMSGAGYGGGAVTSLTVYNNIALAGTDEGVVGLRCFDMSMFSHQVSLLQLPCPLEVYSTAYIAPLASPTVAPRPTLRVAGTGLDTNQVIRLISLRHLFSLMT